MKTARREKKQFETAFPVITWEGETSAFPPHWHECFELLFLTKGGMYVSIDDAISEACAGDLILVNSGAMHGFFDTLPGTAILGMQLDIAFFDDSFFNVRDIIFACPVVGKKNMSEPVYKQMYDLLRGVAQECSAKQPGWQMAVRSKIYELMLNILRESPRAGHKRPSSKAKQIRAFVCKNFDDPELTLEESAAAFKLNKFYFIRFFKKHTGYPFHAYLTKTRVDFAKRYLIESTMPITDVAFRAGFNSLQTFNRVFKTLTGSTPRDFRREHSALIADWINNYREKNE
ncbi:MAG: AraC family transcriptional regulator [Spirochaetaceae bacterium]|jgi:AraC-like DNA-binding protein|nr:AraC family transcriptional regulator [Spirochaetaceae bacterium]